MSFLELLFVFGVAGSVHYQEWPHHRFVVYLMSFGISMKSGVINRLHCTSCCLVPVTIITDPSQPQGRSRLCVQEQPTSFAAGALHHMKYIQHTARAIVAASTPPQPSPASHQLSTSVEESRPDAPAPHDASTASCGTSQLRPFSDRPTNPELDMLHSNNGAFDGDGPDLPRALHAATSPVLHTQTFGSCIPRSLEDPLTYSTAGGEPSFPSMLQSQPHELPHPPRNAAHARFLFNPPQTGY